MIQLTQGEENYILTIPEDKIVVIKPFDKKQTEAANKIISQIKNKFPRLHVQLIGASGLGISGQGDLDMSIYVKPEEFSQYLPFLVEQFGEPINRNSPSIKWEFQIEEIPIELWLTNPDRDTTKKHLEVFNILKNNPELLKEYEDLKINMNGKPFREYQRKKYEFYHAIISS